MPKAEVINLM